MRFALKGFTESSLESIGTAVKARGLATCIVSVARVGPFAGQALSSRGGRNEIRRNEQVSEEASPLAGLGMNTVRDGVVRILALIAPAQIVKAVMRWNIVPV